jgi:hypothetical protein
MTFKGWLGPFVGTVVALSNVAWVGAAEVDKSGYTLFHPTPKEQMREFNTDRPDKTESPYTLDAGHIQVEMDLVNYAWERVPDGSGDINRTAFIFAPNLKFGLTNRSDLQFVFNTYTFQENTASGAPVRNYGLGDLTLRLKANLLGNDGGDVAIGVMPWIKLPTNTGNIGNRFIEAGVILPFAIALPNEWDLGMMLQYNRNKNSADNNFHNKLISSITVGHGLVGELSFYTEFFSQASDESSGNWVATFDVGLTYMATPWIQLDMGLNLGLTPAADDYNPFLGITARF